MYSAGSVQRQIVGLLHLDRDGKLPREHSPLASTGEEGGGHNPAALPGPSNRSAAAASVEAVLSAEELLTWGECTFTGSCTATRIERSGGVGVPGRHDGRTETDADTDAGKREGGVDCASRPPSALGVGARSELASWSALPSWYRRSSLAIEARTGSGSSHTLPQMPLTAV